MKFAIDYTEKRVSAGPNEIDDGEYAVQDVGGFGGADIYIEGGHMTWAQAEALVEALRLHKKLFGADE